MIKTILFDLDGTLLPMDQDNFVESYFRLLVKRTSPLGIDGKELIDAIWHGTKAMVLNDGKKTNRDVFWEDIKTYYKDYSKELENELNDFYKVDFQESKKYCGFNKYAKIIISEIKKRGLQVIIATNPIFPYFATESRMKWAGINLKDVDLYTAYESSSYSKPNIKYYEEIIKKMNLNPKECLMVGNDVDEDMIAEKLGMKVYLVTDCLINKSNKDINVYSNGSLIDFYEYLGKLIFKNNGPEIL